MLGCLVELEKGRQHFDAVQRVSGKAPGLVVAVAAVAVAGIGVIS